YTVCAASGHILELVDPSKINKEWEWNKEFNIDKLPIFIPNWKKVPSKGKSQIVDQIKGLLKDAEYVIHAGDPDDEGQLIVDEILQYCGYHGKVLRVLVNDNIPENIAKAFDHLEDNGKYEFMGKAAYARSMADFCFGINESRLAAMRLHQNVSVGRVQTPTLGLIVNRDEEILNHIERKYYELTAFVDTCSFLEVPFEFRPLASILADEKKIFERSILENIQKDLETIKTSVKIKTKVTEKRKLPPLPYNLTVLQSEMNKLYGFTASQTLEFTQTLRDKFKAITYNRTDCQYLKSEHHQEAKEVMTIAMKNLNENWVLDYSLTSKAFNNSNVSAHHGIIPQKSSFDINKLSSGESAVYRAIVQRYAMQFMEPYIYDKSESVFNTEYGDFIYKAYHEKSKGFKAAFNNMNDEDDENKHKCDIWLNEGEHDGNIVKSEITEKKTSPPKSYTEGTLLTDMSSIAKYVTNSEIKEILKRKDDGKKGEHGGIGTTATRSTIIDKLKEREFIEVKGKDIRSTNKGREFYHLLPDEIKGADITAKWWLLQEGIADGSIKDVNAIQLSVVQVFNAHKDTAYIGKSIGNPQTTKIIIGKCSKKCGCDVIESKNTYMCSSNKFEKVESSGEWKLVEGCGLQIFKEICDKKIPLKMVKELLTLGKTKDKLKGLKSKKTGKTFEAYLVFNKVTNRIEFKFD
ncbi:MAG: DNA topoisomerase, partial [Oscillospiraceae bacterium]|nr:DNA topoisomerase [Oscillospiraceae bacterium]